MSLYVIVMFISLWSQLMQGPNSQVKVLKRPRFEIAKLMELHGEGGGGKRGEGGDKSERPEGYEPPVQETV